MIDQFPNEIIEVIISFMDTPSIMTVSSTNKKLYCFIKNNSLFWRKKSQEEYSIKALSQRFINRNSPFVIYQKLLIFFIKSACVLHVKRNV
jgi:hypothetical protein